MASPPDPKNLYKTAAAVAAGAVALGGVYFLLRKRKRPLCSGDGAVLYPTNNRTNYEKTIFSDEELLLRIREEAIDYAMCNGLVMREKTGSQSFVHAPITLLPAILPRKAFKQATDIAAVFSSLIDKIARHPSYLEDVLVDVSKNDNYTKGLLEILSEVRNQGDRKQNITLGLFRSDYMLQKSLGPDSKFPTPRFLQVENNTIAASFGGLSSRVASLHAHILQRFHKDTLQRFGDASLPKNPAVDNLAEAMAKAVEAYAKAESVDVKEHDLAVMMVVQPGESNAGDQRLLEYSLMSNHNIRMIRATFKEVSKAYEGVNSDGKKLFFHGFHIALVYFRAGYTPKDLPSPVEWEAYRSIELSRAIKCPCIAYHLAGTKKIQQKLSEAKELEKFLDAADSDMVRLFFADQFSLSEPLEASSEKAIKDAIHHTERYVLKPQREGGGNNLWLDDMKEALELKTMTKQERTAYILMSCIEQEPFTAALLRNGQVIVGECLKEIGIYASFLGGTGDQEPYQKTVGHLMRTKLVGTNEGGVATGYAVIDSPALV
mmetsp:Transcript_25581/g.42862  ORF Transcript_25581/g.42862 Transcript_25581/m.42862 type:complete len:546 (-) Transcript_25581:148-1785(-)